MVSVTFQFRSTSREYTKKPCVSEEPREALVSEVVNECVASVAEAKAMVGVEWDCLTDTTNNRNPICNAQEYQARMSAKKLQCYPAKLVHIAIKDLMGNALVEHDGVVRLPPATKYQDVLRLADPFLSFEEARVELLRGGRPIQQFYNYHDLYLIESEANDVLRIRQALKLSMYIYLNGQAPHALLCATEICFEETLNATLERCVAAENERKADSMPTGQKWEFRLGPKSDYKEDGEKVGGEENAIFHVMKHQKYVIRAYVIKIFELEIYAWALTHGRPEKATLEVRLHDTTEEALGEIFTRTSPPFKPNFVYFKENGRIEKIAVDNGLYSQKNKGITIMVYDEIQVVLKNQKSYVPVTRDDTLRSVLVSAKTMTPFRLGTSVRNIQNWICKTGADPKTLSKNVKILEVMNPMETLTCDPR